MNVAVKTLTPLAMQGENKALLPDKLSFGAQSIPDEHIISKTRDGYPCSRFNDSSWNFSAYTHMNSRRIHFKDENINSRIMLEMKEILCFNWYGSGLAYSTFTGQVSEARFIARYATRNQISFKYALQSDLVVYERIAGLNDHAASVALKRMAGFINACLRSAQVFGDEHPYQISNRLVATMTSKASKLLNAQLLARIQTHVIPTRIYAAFINQGIEAIDHFLTISDEIEAYLKIRSKFFREKATAEGINIKSRSDRESSRLNAWAKRYTKGGMAKSISHLENIQNMTTYCSNIYRVCHSLIMAFTGMRDGEAKCIPYDGFCSISYGEQTVYGFNSYTSKLHGGVPELEFWVTGEVAEKVNRAAQAICRIRVIGQLHLNFPRDRSRLPLFVGYQSYEPGPLFDLPTGIADSGKVTGEKYVCCFSNPEEFIINDLDMAEVESLDPYADHAKKKVMVGNYWPFSSHQMRRSLVVYATKASLRMNVIQTQLKHTMIEQTAYYGRGSIYAKHFIKSLAQSDEKSGLATFASELHQEEVDEMTDTIQQELVEQPERLFGGSGANLQKEKDLNELQPRFSDPNLTIKAVTNGEVSIRKGPANWCMATEPCEKLAFSIPIPCVACGKAVFVDNESTIEILEDQIEIFEQRIKKNGPGPFSQSDQQQIDNIQRLLNSRHNRIPLEEK